MVSSVCGSDEVHCGWEGAELWCDGCDGVVDVWAQDEDDERTLEEEERVAEEEGDENANEVSDMWCVGL